MAYDEDLAERIREALTATKGTTEINMFGGLCWTVRGNMAVGIAKDELMVRMAPERRRGCPEAKAHSSDGFHRQADEGVPLRRSGRPPHPEDAPRMGRSWRRIRLIPATEEAQGQEAEVGGSLRERVPQGWRRATAFECA